MRRVTGIDGGERVGSSGKGKGKACHSACTEYLTAERNRAGDPVLNRDRSGRRCRAAAHSYRDRCERANCPRRIGLRARAGEPRGRSASARVARGEEGGVRAIPWKKLARFLERTLAITGALFLLYHAFFEVASRMT